MHFYEGNPTLIFTISTVTVFWRLLSFVTEVVTNGARSLGQSFLKLGASEKNASWGRCSRF